MKLAARIKKIEFESFTDSTILRDDDTIDPTMTVEFPDAGGGSFIRINSSTLLPINAEDMVSFAEFLEWVCEQNDRIRKEELL
jgi:hypothetical protein